MTLTQFYLSLSVPYKRTDNGLSISTKTSVPLWPMIYVISMSEYWREGYFLINSWWIICDSVSSSVSSPHVATWGKWGAQADTHRKWVIKSDTVMDYSLDKLYLYMCFKTTDGIRFLSYLYGNASCLYRSSCRTGFRCSFQNQNPPEIYRCMLYQ